MKNLLFIRQVIRQSICLAENFSKAGLAFLAILASHNAEAQTWEQLSPYPTVENIISSSFINSNEGWISTNSDVFKTGDAGGTWQTLQGLPTPAYLSFLNSNIGYARYSTLLYKSVDGGTTWNSITLPGALTGDFFFLNPDTGYAGGSNTLYRTLDGGNTWTSYNIGINYLYSIQFLNFNIGYASYDGGIFKTLDGGASWDVVLYLYGGGEQLFENCYFLNQDTGFAGGYYSSLGLENPDIIYKTTDGGNSWYSVYFGDYLGADSKILDIRFKDDNNGFAISQSESNVYTNDGGETWIPIYTYAGYDNFGIEGDYLSDLSGESDLFAVGNGGGIYEWPADSVNFHEVDKRFGWNYDQPIKFLNADTGFILNNTKGIYKTLDGGANWEWLPESNLTFILFDAVNSEFLIAIQFFDYPTYNVYTSNDGGTTWANVFTSSDLYLTCLTMLDEDTGFIGSYDGKIWKTTDGGQTWQSSSVASTGILKIQFVNANEGWAATSFFNGNKIYHTTDAGATWILQSTQPYSINDFYFLDSLHGWQIVYNTGDYYSTTDGGNTWTYHNISGANYKEEIKFYDLQRGWMITQDAIYETSDGGSTWAKTLDAPSTLYHLEFVAGDKAFATGRNSLLLREGSSCPPPISSFISSNNGLTVQFTDQSQDATSWSWNFDDGNSSSQQNPSHTYITEGSYDVCLTASNSCGGNISCQTLYVCNPLNTDYLYQANELTYTFLNQITEATSFFWDFGDGTTSTQQNPLHDFSSSGTYHVCLVESDACSSDTMCKDLIVCGTVFADFNFTVNGTTIQFNDASTNALNWSWDFGDGNFSSDQNPSHMYSQSGTYTACLIASDDCSSDTICESIITGASCNASFMLVADTLNPGFYWGYNLSGGDNLIYSWTWGDGTSSTGQYPIHLYADSGFYTICQMIYDSIGGCADTFCADYTILKSSGMMGIHEINFVDYPLNIPSSNFNAVEWSVFPNPFSDNTTISFTLPSKQKISLGLFDLSGRKVRSIADGNFAGSDSYGEDGNHSIQLSKRNLSEGIYFLKLQTESTLQIKQVIIQ